MISKRKALHSFATYILTGVLLIVSAGSAPAENADTTNGAEVILVGIGAGQSDTGQNWSEGSSSSGVTGSGMNDDDDDAGSTGSLESAGSEDPAGGADNMGSTDSSDNSNLANTNGSSFGVGFGGNEDGNGNENGNGNGNGNSYESDGDESWKLILVNATHPIPEGYQIPELTDLQNGNSVDSRIYPALQQMFDDARAQGIYPYVTSSYRSTEKQQELMDEKIDEYLNAGYSQEDAKKLAEEWVAIPGTSEHQLGLSVDISSDPASGQDAGAVWYWLKLYCWDYGFILRYPEDKTDITGIINEPWHFRYVGIEAAQEMKESGQCLEEYLGEI